MTDWTRRSEIEVPKDEDAYDSSVLEIEYFPDAAEDTINFLGEVNTWIMGGLNVQPNASGQTITMPYRHNPRVLDKIVIIPQAEPSASGYLQLAIYNVREASFNDPASFDGDSADFVAGPLVYSNTVDVSELPYGNIVEEVEFTFEDDLILNPLEQYSIAIRFIGIMDSLKFVRVAAANGALYVNPDNLYEGGNLWQALFGVTNFLSDDWSECTVNNDQAQGLFSLFFKLYTRPSQDYIVDSSWTERTVPASPVWDNEPTLPNDSWSRFAGYDDFWVRERVQILDSVALVMESRIAEKLVRELATVDEAASSDHVGSLAETASVLDLVDVEQRERFLTLDDTEETVYFLENVEVDVDGRNVDKVVDNELLAVSEGITANQRIGIGEEAKFLDQVDMYTTERNVDKPLNEYLRVVEQITAHQHIRAIVEESISILDSVAKTS